MDVTTVYACLQDRTRIRILHLLTKGALCVCHLQEVLGEPQVKISRHLAYLRQHGVVTARRDGQWMVYQLPRNPAPVLQHNLDCLVQCAQHDATLQRDAEHLARRYEAFAADAALCCPAPSSVRGTRTSSLRR